MSWNISFDFKITLSWTEYKSKLDEQCIKNVWVFLTLTICCVARKNYTQKYGHKQKKKCLAITSKMTCLKSTKTYE